MDERRLTWGLALLHIVNVGIGIAWWCLAPGPNFNRYAILLTGVFAFVWALAAIIGRRLLTPLTAAAVIALGTLLPWIWIIAIWIGLVAFTFAITTGVFGIVFLALAPLLAWAAFVAVHFAGRWILRELDAG